MIEISVNIGLKRGDELQAVLSHLLGISRYVISAVNVDKTEIAENEMRLAGTLAIGEELVVISRGIGVVKRARLGIVERCKPVKPILTVEIVKLAECIRRGLTHNGLRLVEAVLVFISVKLYRSHILDIFHFKRPHLFASA